MMPAPHQHRPPAVHRSQCGLTLIELMVAIVIGLILTAGVIQIFLGSHQTYRFQEELSRIQENGRFALETLARDVRNSDFRGCAGTALDEDSITDLTDGGGNDTANFDMADAVWGFTFNGGWSPTLDGDVGTHDPDQGGDVIRLRSLDFGGSALVSEHQSKGANLFVDDTSHFEQNQNVIATNCTEGVKFTITNDPSSGGTPQLTVAKGHSGFYDTYQPTGVHSGFGQRYYFVHRDDNGGEPSLARLRDDGTIDQLAEGVEGMAFSFGVDTSGDFEVNEYRTADAVNDWDSVMAVRISLLLRGRAENVTEEPQVVSFPPGETFDDTADRRLRQVFTATVSLRNRMP